MFIKRLKEGQFQKCDDVFNGEQIQWSKNQTKNLSLFNEALKRHYRPSRTGGHVSWHPEQEKIYHEIAKMDFVKTICEVGFYAGHSAFIWLNSNPKVKVFSFDRGGVFEIANELKVIFPHRFQLILGPSQKTVPEFHIKNTNVKCDIVFIDGSKRTTDHIQDFNNLYKMVNVREPNMITIDDTDIDSVLMPWQEHVKKGKAEQFLHCNDKPHLSRGLHIKHAYVIGRFL